MVDLPQSDFLGDDPVTEQLVDVGHEVDASSR
jgi:hypothetical protein